MNFYSFLQNYNLYLILLIATLISVLWLLQFKKEFRAKWYAMLILAALHTVAGVLCVKLFAQLEGLFDPPKTGNMSLFGGVFFLPLFYFLGAKIFKRDTKMIFDVFTFPMMFTLMCSRFNCLITGCCQGIVLFGDFHFPARGAEIAFYLLMCHLLGKKILKKDFDGSVYPIYMIAYGIFRFIVEWFREPNIVLGPVHISHVWAIISALAGTAFLLYLRKVKKPKKRHPH